MHPSFACTFDELNSKVGKEVTLKTPRSALVVEGAGVRLESLELEGALTIKACPGAFVTVKGLVVKNKGWRFTKCGDDAGEVDRLRGFVVEKDETETLVFDTPRELHRAVSARVPRGKLHRPRPLERGTGGDYYVVHIQSHA